MTTLLAVSVGGVIGSVLTAVANFVLQREQDKRRWQREDQVSLRLDRVRIYREIIVTLELVKDGRSPCGEEPFAIHESLMPTVAEMKLISPDDVVYAAERAVSVAQLREHLSQKNETGERVEHASLDLEEAVEEFIENVREDLGLPKEAQASELVITRQTGEGS